MQTFFSTDGIHPRNAFRRWREAICDRLIPMDLEPLHEVPFEGKLDVTNIGSTQVSKLIHTPMRTEATPDAVRRYRQPDRLYAAMKLSRCSNVGFLSNGCSLEAIRVSWRFTYKGERGNSRSRVFRFFKAGMRRERMQPS